MVLLPEGANLTLSELREIAARQQQQIEAQQQLLIAKVQRLKFLKQQEARHHQEAQTTENERLRFIQEKLESQEIKLRRLRTLNGQAEQQRTNNNQLSSELESVQLLVNEKEKELSSAVEKVENLTLQLEELRKGNLNDLKNDNISTSSSQELAKLKHELIYQTKLTEQQSLQIVQQQKLLTQRQDEVSRADQRILELKQRLHRKQLHNQQLSKQLQMTVSIPKSNNQRHLRPSSCNIASVEPVRRSQDQERSQDDFHANLTTVDFREFLPNKNDPKYQTLPYNTKFTVRNGMLDEPNAQAHKVETKSSVVPLNSNENENCISSKPVAFECTSQLISANKLYISPKLNHLSPRPYGAPYAVCHVPSTVPVPVSSSTSNNATTIHPALTNVNNFMVQVSASSCLTTTSPSQPGSTTRATSVHSDAHKDDNSNTNCNSAVDKPNSLHPCTVQFTNNSKNSNSVSWIKPPTNKSDDKSKLQTEYSNLSSNSNNNNKPVVPPKPIKPLPSSRQTQVDGNCDDKQDSVDLALAVLKNTGLETSTGYSGYRERLLYYQYFPRYNLKSGSSKSHYTDKREQPKQEETQGTNVENSVNCKDESPQKRTVIGQLPIQPKPLTIKKPMRVEPPRLRNSGIPVLSTHKRSIDTSLQAHSLLGMQFGNNSHKHPIVRKVEHPFHRQEASEIGSAENEKTNSSSENNSSKETGSTSALVNCGKTDQGKQNEEEKNSNFSKFEMQVETDDANFGSVDNENGVRTEGDGDSGCETVPSNTSSYLCEKKSELEHNLQENAPGQESVALRRIKKGNLKTKDTAKSPRRVSFDPLALLLDASLEGEVELVKKTACEVPNPSAANDEGITALHNAICAGHLEIVTFLVELGCDVNTQDSDGWTPLHCAASCNNLPMVKYLVDHGACIFATTFSDQETAAEKCEEDEDGFDGCSEYLYSIQEKLGIMNGGIVYAVYDYECMRPDELSFKNGDEIVVLKKGDEVEREWWWSSLNSQEGYVPRNLLGLYPRVNARSNQ